MRKLWRSSGHRVNDNSRTQMQWSSEANAGFTMGIPWQKVNPNYNNINVEFAQRDENSVLNFYKKMIALKKANEVFRYGRYDLLKEEDPQIYAYTRTLDAEKVIVLANLSDQSAVVQKDLSFSYQYHQLLLNNYRVMEHAPLSELTLKPFEARVYRV